MVFLYVLTLLLYFVNAGRALQGGGDTETVSDFEKGFDGWTSKFWVREKYQSDEKTSVTEGVTGSYYISPGWTLLTTPTIIRTFIIHPNSVLELDFTCRVKGWKKYRSPFMSHLLNPGLQVYFNGRDMFDFATHGLKNMGWATYRLTKNFSSASGKVEISFAGWEGSRRGKVGLDHIRVAWAKNDLEDAGGPIEYEQPSHKWRNINPHPTQPNVTAVTTTPGLVSSRGASYHQWKSSTSEKSSKQEENEKLIYENKAEFEDDFDGWQSRFWYRINVFGTEAKKYSVPPPPNNNSKYFIAPGYNIYGFKTPRLLKVIKVPPKSKLEMDFTLFVKGWNPTTLHSLLNLNPGLDVYYNRTRVFSVSRHAVITSKWVNYRLIANFARNTQTHLTLKFYGWTGIGRKNYIAIDDIIIRWSPLDSRSATDSSNRTERPATVSFPFVAETSNRRNNTGSTEREDMDASAFQKKTSLTSSGSQQNDLINNRPSGTFSSSSATPDVSETTESVSANKLWSAHNGKGSSTRFTAGKGTIDTTERSATLGKLRPEGPHIPTKLVQVSTTRPNFSSSSTTHGDFYFYFTFPGDAGQESTKTPSKNVSDRKSNQAFAKTQKTSPSQLSNKANRSNISSDKPNTYSEEKMESSFSTGLLFLIAALIVVIIVTGVIVCKKYRSPATQDEFTPINFAADGRLTVREYDNPVFEVTKWREQSNSAVSINQGRT